MHVRLVTKGVSVKLASDWFLCCAHAPQVCASASGSTWRAWSSSSSCRASCSASGSGGTQATPGTRTSPATWASPSPRCPTTSSSRTGRRRHRGALCSPSSQRPRFLFARLTSPAQLCSRCVTHEFHCARSKNIIRCAASSRKNAHEHQRPCSILAHQRSALGSLSTAG